MQKKRVSEDLLDAISHVHIILNVRWNRESAHFVTVYTLS